MAELFLFGTLWFWVLTVAAFILITASAENESGTSATICLILYLALLQWMGGNDILGYLVNHPARILIAALIYFVIGTIWGVAKWAIYVKGRSQEALEVFRDYCQEKKISYTSPIDLDVWKAFMKDLDSDKSYNSRKIAILNLLEPPRIRNYKEQFIRWLSFWPWSLIYTLMNDIVRNVCRQIYLAMANRLQEISDGIYNRALPKE